MALVYVVLRIQVEVQNMDILTSSIGCRIGISQKGSRFASELILPMIQMWIKVILWVE
jgi:hypothetical protein